MALSGVAQYRAAMPIARVGVARGGLATVAGRMYDMWPSAPFNGATPTTPAVPTAATTGALLASPSGVATWIKTIIGCQTPGAVFTIYDRLSHQAGLSGIVTGTVTTNLPTAALTRYTNGVGVMMAVEVYTLIGTTATTISVSYTNSAGVAGRTSPAVTFGGSNDRQVAQFLPIPLQVGDVGVRSVESVNLAGTTGTAGNYGVTLWKPLATVPSQWLARGSRFDNLRDMGGWFENIAAGACLCGLQAAFTTQTWVRAAELHLISQV